MLVSPAGFSAAWETVIIEARRFSFGTWSNRKLSTSLLFSDFYGGESMLLTEGVIDLKLKLSTSPAFLATEMNPPLRDPYG